MKRGRIALLAGGSLVAALVLAVALVPAARRAVVMLLEPRDAAVRTVTSEEDLRAAFNAHPERTRVVAWLSPT